MSNPYESPRTISSDSKDSNNAPKLLMRLGVFAIVPFLILSIGNRVAIVIARLNSESDTLLEPLGPPNLCLGSVAIVMATVAGWQVRLEVRNLPWVAFLPGLALGAVEVAVFVTIYSSIRAKQDWLVPVIFMLLTVQYVILHAIGRCFLHRPRAFVYCGVFCAFSGATLAILEIVGKLMEK